ncbi:formylglycine-generating enzyme family protein [bacterium]|nr:formylglycine-generating enzyme family protein [bacterium]MBP5592480.1 formylglycine-generating enzyme family protein [bacterium]
MNYLRKIFTLLVLALLLSACGEEDYLYKKIGQDFDNNGGVYKGVNGVTVHIEAGSLPEGTDVVTITAYALDTPAFTNVSKPVTNIYSISPAAFEFAKNLTVVIPYKETDFPNLLDELDLKPYFSMDRQNFEVFDEDSYELDVENNLFKISTRFLGNFHIGFPKDLVKQEDADQAGIAEMVLIPGGEFEFGAPEGTPTGLTEEDEGLKQSEGTNTVKLSAYYIDKYEVSNSQYRLCQDAGVCTEPYDVTSIMYQNYYYNATYAGFPVIWVSYNQAATFCQWAGKKLPTEAQWEKAARGKTMRTYPWGDKEPADNIEATQANHTALFGDVTSVMWGDDGVSPYGVYNMAGNVAEWTDTWYNIDSYYQKRTDGVVIEDPIGPSDSPTQEKVIRGGSWVSLEDEITTYSRDKAFPNYRYYNLGFRCVQPVSK